MFLVELSSQQYALYEVPCEREDSLPHTLMLCERDGCFVTYQVMDKLIAHLDYGNGHQTVDELTLLTWSVHPA